MLLGRGRESRAITDALGRARGGESATLVLAGESGIGKTVLLDHAAGLAGDMALLRARGVESEAQVPFAALLELLRPALDVLGAIPRPQAVALEGALALRPGVPHDRFLVGAASLSLLSAYGDRAPVAVLVDDVQWLDRSSAQALLFAFRRLVADPVAVLLTVRAGEPSLVDGAGLPVLPVRGLTAADAAELLPGLPPAAVTRLCEATGGNPLALLELDPGTRDLEPAPAGAPVVVSARVAEAFLRRAAGLDEPARRALALVAASDTGDLLALGGAAAIVNVDLSALERAEGAGLVALGGGRVEFRHPLVRSAIYAAAAPGERRAAHRALAATLPDRDVDRRAWHLAAAATGPDDAAAAALEQAGARARERSAYAAAGAAFARAARLAPDPERRARLLREAADSEWKAGFAPHAVSLLDEARAGTDDRGLRVEIDALAGHIAARRGPVLRGHAILSAAAEEAGDDVAVALLAEATSACLYAGAPALMLATSECARERLTAGASRRAIFLADVASGMARIVGGEPASGAVAIRRAVALVEDAPDLRGDLRVLPWLAIAPMFLRESDTGRALLDEALRAARAAGAVGALPLVLNLIARDQATTHRWKEAESSYREAIELARESEQRTDIAFGLAGLAWLQARRGEEGECRALAAEALVLCRELGTRLLEVWAYAALGELEAGRGDVQAATRSFEQQERLLQELDFTDVDVHPGPELVDGYVRLGQRADAERVADDFGARAETKGQPWSLGRALRARGLLAGDAEFAGLFEDALVWHDKTPDAFETARTRLAYGERLRRARDRVLARGQLRAALEAFERLGASPWAERARTELAASGETLRRRDPATMDELTPQELRIALLLAGGRTTREAAAMLFLSPKTVEYHLRHVYQKLDVHSRGELAEALAR